MTVAKALAFAAAVGSALGFVFRQIDFTSRPFVVMMFAGHDRSLRMDQAMRVGRRRWHRQRKACDEHRDYG